MENNAKIDATNRTTTIDTTNELVIADKIILNEAVVDK